MRLAAETKAKSGSKSFARNQFPSALADLIPRSLSGRSKSDKSPDQFERFHRRKFSIWNEDWSKFRKLAPTGQARRVLQPKLLQLRLSTPLM